MLCSRLYRLKCRNKYSSYGTGFTNGGNQAKTKHRTEDNVKVKNEIMETHEWSLQLAGGIIKMLFSENSYGDDDGSKYPKSTVFISLCKSFQFKMWSSDLQLGHCLVAY